jgi:hypothetical protein
VVITLGGKTGGDLLLGCLLEEIAGVSRADLLWEEGVVAAGDALRRAAAPRPPERAADGADRVEDGTQQADDVPVGTLASTGINLSMWAVSRADHNEGGRNLHQKTLDAVGLGFDS